MLSISACDLPEIEQCDEVTLSWKILVFAFGTFTDPWSGFVCLHVVFFFFSVRHIRRCFYASTLVHVIYVVPCLKLKNDLHFSAKSNVFTAFWFEHVHSLATYCILLCF